MSPTTLQGRDVSSHNTDAQIQEALKYDFIGIKVTEGNGHPNDPSCVDIKAADTIAKARAAGLLIVLYHFAHPENNPVDEARWFLKYANPQAGDVLALDMEPYYKTDWTAEEVAGWLDWMIAFLSEIMLQEHCLSAVYLNDDIANRVMSPHTAQEVSILQQYVLWKAQYGESIGDTFGFKTVGFWQYDATDIDKDVFLGDRSDWLALAVPKKEEQMANTTNGWPALSHAPGPQFVAAGEGAAHDVVSNDLAVLMAYVVMRWHTEIEPVTQCAGGRTISENAKAGGAPGSDHISYTAIDVNWNKHPYEARGGTWRSGFTRRQEQVLRSILKECEVLQWGGDFPSPYRDSMHIQVKQDLRYLQNGPRVVSEKDVANAAAKIGAWVKRVQESVGCKCDGVAGPGYVDAVKAWQKSKRLTADGVFGPASAAAAGWNVPVPAPEKPSPAPAPTPQKPSPKPGPTPSVIVKGDTGPAVEDVQRKVGVKVDGKFGSATKSAVERLQVRLGVKKDGEWGPATQKAYDAFCDGRFGAGTIKLWQRNAKTPVDGKISRPSQLISKVQRKRKISSDGILGPNTWKAIQKWVGVTPDGIPGEKTITALQQALLRGEW